VSSVVRQIGEPLDVLVVIVNYKSAELTLRSLVSLSAERIQPRLRLNVVVVENASGDEAALETGIRERFGDFARLVVSPVNGGFGAGNNLGVRAAREAGIPFDYVHFLNPDTEVRPGAVAILARFLKENPRAGLASGSFEHQDGTLWPIAFRFPSIAGEIEGGVRLGIVSRLFRSQAVARTMGDQPEPIDWCSGASMMVRREVLETAGGFDEAFFLYFEEVDLCRRIKAAGYECWYVPASRVMHVRGQSTGVTVLGKPSRLPDYWFESRRRYYVKHHGVRYTAWVDAASLLANGVGALRDTVKRVPQTPKFLRDLARQSVFWAKNRGALEPSRDFVLAPETRASKGPALRRVGT
jgi:N-acetylglucosaminyl-diphospho-decaprenol L-rhamnosyltransferase